jgi:uncharacterized membrane protein
MTSPTPLPTTSRERDLRALEVTIGRVLRVGIVTSSICLGAGLLLSLTGESGRIANVVLSSGLVILLGTPAARVIVSVVEYVRERDWVFAGLTFTVLLALATGVAIAIFEAGTAASR